MGSAIGGGVGWTQRWECRHQSDECAELLLFENEVGRMNRARRKATRMNE
jgi:hypothetical protein